MLKKYAVSLLVLLVALLFTQRSFADTGTHQTVSDTLSNASPSSASTPVMAMHTITLTPVTAVPALGNITLMFPALSPGDTGNAASPSASAFEFNGLSQSEVAVNGLSGDQTFSISVTNPAVGVSGKIVISLTGTTTISQAAPVTVFLGCSAQSAGVCTNSTPVIINPTKTKPSGQEDTWNIGVETFDSSGTLLDISHTVIGTNDTVSLHAEIDPTLTFIISGINNQTDLSLGHGTSCPKDMTNAGVGSSASLVSLEKVGTGITLSAQDISISTNGIGGYALTATSSGQLTSPSNGHMIASSPTPASITAGIEAFGIHPCGSDANTDFIPASGVTANQGGKIAWPTLTTPISLAQKSGFVNADITTIEYAITAASKTPEGIYNSTITYMVTPKFE